MMTTNNQSIVKKSEENLAETIKEITIIVNKSPAVATSSSDVKFSSTNSNKKVKIDKKQSMRRTLELPPKIVSNHETTNKSSRVAEMVKELEKQEKRKRSESDGPLTEKNQNASGKKRAIEKEESGVVKLVKEITRNEKGNDKEESFVDNGNEDKDHAAKAGDDKNCFGVFDVGSFGFRFC